ncbi:MAG: asparagine synthase-related protein, partial [Desulfobacterales bacterium]
MGYIAGMIDTDGSISKSGTIRISQSRSVNFVKYNNIKGLGSTLSGGLDTSWVVLNAAKVKNPVHTYTCNYKYNLF